MLGRRIAARQPPPICLPELRRALLDECCNIPQDQIDNLILSMPRRSKACIASSGRHTPHFRKVHGESGLLISLCNIATDMHRNPMTVMRIWNQLVQEDPTDRHAGSHRQPLASNVREGRHVGISGSYSHIKEHQEVDLFAAQ
ncbi:transposable element Tcb2 transposase [Trichonephila clavipes]|nr:transposable element Tcb2 transposase [Trichonephila clavipes]